MADDRPPPQDGGEEPETDEPTRLKELELEGKRLDREELKAAENDLNRRRKELKGKMSNHERRLKWYWFFFVVFFLTGMVVLVLLLLMIVDYLVNPASTFRLGFLSQIILVLFSSVSYALALAFRLRSRSIEKKIDDIDFEIDLMTFGASRRTRRAEQLLKISRTQLRRYYDLNLSQNSWIFVVGIFCILLGVAVVAMTLYFITVLTETGEEQIVTALVGSAGTIMTEFVAVIFLQMYKKTTESLEDFYKELVSTHEQYFANLLISRITNSEQRNDSLQELALAIAKQGDKAAPTKPPESATSAKSPESS